MISCDCLLFIIVYYRMLYYIMVYSGMLWQMFPEDVLRFPAISHGCFQIQPWDYKIQALKRVWGLGFRV